MEINNINFKNELELIFDLDEIKYDESMKKHNSFKVGGNADVFVIANSVEKVEKLITLSNKYKLPVTIIGNGSNIIVRDEGIRGIVLKYISDNYNINAINENEYLVSVDSGMVNGKLAQILLNEELGGFEFAAAIPGTIGGAVFMNAGAFGSEMKDIIQEVTFLDLDDKKVYNSKAEDCEFSYRKSKFENINGLILSVKLKLRKDNKKDIENKMNEFLHKRLETQPTDYPNAGSTFKRGNDFITAKVIDEAGLKGYRIGGAEVSKKHAGFIINTGDATAKDILDLIEYVKKEVLEKTGKQIEEEVRII